MHFNFAKFSFGLSPRQRFGIFTGFGLDYSRMCLDGDITIRRGKGEMLHAVPLSEWEIADVKRSTFKTLYLTIPLMLEKILRVYRFCRRHPFAYQNKGCLHE